jgi:hypothetical protein
VATADAFFVGVDKENLTSAATSEMGAAEQTKSSAFITVQSFTNFAAAAGAITTAWQALEALSPDFDTRLTPFVLAVAWLAMSLVTSAQSIGADAKKLPFWVSALFLGFMNALTLFAAVIGVSTAV